MKCGEDPVAWAEYVRNACMNGCLYTVVIAPCSA